MRLVLCVVAVLFGCPLGEMFVLHPSPEASAVKANRCKGELEIRKILLESLNLQQEPRVSVLKMHHLREQWKASMRSSPTSAPAGNSTFPEDSRNSSCCKHSCQVFIKDLGWERWVVYPESITFVQCRSCGSESADAPAQCCKPTAHDIVPFLYVDDWSGWVLSSVSLIRQCGCDPGEQTQDPEVMTLS
ncbi:bone morphogenetic protein 5-like [Sinocyclocheilus rhinocerous]|uniref:bone morphogenetic protein 5-like n=1 Tax=Sinocyclocheilus rhinocerous TaxID=307959 RepID=UPI0007B7AA95|nr:PREDICTED: bone morphogenetic protein 5-like [Sinocyclocheilus rhinocerous]